MEYMSSEESDGNDNELKVHQIPWLSENVKKFKQLLDSEKLKHMSAQSKDRQRRRLWLKEHHRDRSHHLGRPGFIKHPS